MDRYKNTKIQEEMKELTKQIHTTTKGHYIVMSVLTMIIALSAIATIFRNTGRYAISQVDKTGVFILDTKTSRLWIRTIEKKATFDLGTNENPKDLRKDE